MQSTAPLNAFQKLQRLWETVHPYNAAQVLKIAGPADREAVNRAWREAIAATGLGPVRADEKSFTFQTPNGHLAAEPVKWVTGQSLTDFISTDINVPFDDPHAPPFRPFVIAADDFYHAGVVYQHWVADSVSIRMLLREWFTRMYDRGRSNGESVRISSEPYWKLLGPKRAGWDLVGGAFSLVRRHARFRQVRKIDSRGIKSSREQFLMRSAPDGLIDGVREYCRARDVKVNDVFLAAMAEACNKLVPTQTRANRQDLAIGNIVDLRPYCPEDLTHTFGLYLGFTDVICRPGDLKNFDRLLRVIALQTREQKETRAAAASTLWMSAALTLSRISPADQMLHVYRKEIPLAGGVSNVDMTRTWASKYHPAKILDFIRVSPTGPLVPVALTTTTLGSRFHFGLTYRTALMSDDLAARLASTILDRLTRIA